MLSKSLILSKKNPKAQFNIIRERPYLILEKITIEDNESSVDISKLKLKITSYPSEESKFITLEAEKNVIKISNPPEVQVPNNCTKIEVEIDYESELNDEVSVSINYLNIKYYHREDPEKEFKAHLDNPLNNKIMFSAPYGQGKTTFLNYYFEKYFDEYEVIRVFPVNYSISSNEDIFRYIKTDILTQLLGRVVFKKETISYLTSSEEYFYLNPIKASVNFLKIVLSLNKATVNLKGVVELFEELAKEVSTYKEKYEVDETESAYAFIKNLYEAEGSVFEDNYYTQLIRYYIEELSINKKTVLLIDDLDRLDPDHIFRILNVISAHYDVQQNSNEDYSNKFSFDKIILVSDIENIRQIFEYRYGKKVRFDGYINKFYSTNPFCYNNKSMLISLLDKSINEHNNSFSREREISDLYYTILYGLILNESITLRSFFKLNINQVEVEFDIILRNLNSQKGRYLNNPVFKVLHYLNLKLVDNIFLNFLIKLKQSDYELMNYNVHYLCNLLLDALGINKQNEKIRFLKIEKYNIEMPYEKLYSYKYDFNISVYDEEKNIVSLTDFYNYDNFLKLIVMANKKYNEVINLVR